MRRGPLRGSKWEGAFDSAVAAFVARPNSIVWSRQSSFSSSIVTQTSFKLFGMSLESSGLAPREKRRRQWAAGNGSNGASFGLIKLALAVSIGCSGP